MFSASSFCISHCLSIANSVPGSNLLCRGTTVTSVLFWVFFFILTWLPFCPTISNLCLLRNFISSLPDTTGSFIAIISSAYCNRTNLCFAQRVLLKHCLNILIFQVEFNSFLKVAERKLFSSPLACNTKLRAQGNKGNRALGDNSRQFSFHINSPEKFIVAQNIKILLYCKKLFFAHNYLFNCFTF